MNATAICRHAGIQPTRRGAARTARLVAVLPLFSLGAAQAASLFGSVTVDGHLPGAALPMQLACGGRVIATTQIDPNGAYRLSTPAAAAPPCEVRVVGAAVAVVVYPNPSRYDFALGHAGGKTQLVQR